MCVYNIFLLENLGMFSRFSNQIYFISDSELYTHSEQPGCRFVFLI